MAALYRGRPGAPSGVAGAHPGRRKRADAVMLSYSPEQVVETFWEKAVMPVVFAALASHYRPSDVSDPNSPAAAANGQYILIRRDIYDAIGGHAAGGGEML